MDRRLRVGLNIALVLVLAAGSAVLLRQQLRWRESAEAQDKAAQIARFDPPDRTYDPADPPDPVAEELAGLDLAALQAVNPEVAGWLYVPGTVISYPLLQGADNDYYLRHTWEKKWNGGGSIFLDCRCPWTMDGFNTIIYGHRMNNGTMFGPLHGYEDPDFWREHPYVYLMDGGGVRRYAVFAAWEPSVTSFVYAVEPEDRQTFIDRCLESSWLDTGLAPGPEDRLLTLSTCMERGSETRWVVQGVLEQAEEIG